MPNRRRTNVSAFILIALVAAMTGCGGSSGPATSGRPESSAVAQPQRSAFTSGAQAICSRRHHDLAGLRRAKLSRLPALAAKRSAVEQRVIGEMEALDAPSELASTWRQIIVYTKTLAGDTAKLGEDARSRDLKGLRIVAAASEGTLRQLAGVAGGAGLKECAQT
jgi:hypothetical protein